MNCPNCGHATPPTSVARCGHCNYKLPESPKPKAAKLQTTVSCWNCHHPNAAEAERCEHCNAKIQASPHHKLSKSTNTHPKTRQPSNIASHDE
ncbi:MAG: zinc ribbon domain-containing protein [Lewinellaceae bacterium]|nr:zinc ribbon domain-containing protein [Lewinellaceae bacterium]